MLDMLGIDTPAIRRWRLAELDDILDRFDADMEDAAHAINMTSTDDYRGIVLFTAGKCLLMFRSVILLSAHGFPESALALARNIYEQFVIVRYFETIDGTPAFQESINNYLIDYNIQRNKALKYVYEHSESEELKEELEKMESAAQEYKPESSKSTKREYWWADENSFSDLVERIIQQHPIEQQFLYTLHSIYKRACIALHASFFGNVIRLGGDNDFWGVESSPTLEGHGTPLFFATASFITIVGVACRLFDIDFAPYCEELNELAMYYQKQSEHEGMNAIEY